MSTPHPDIITGAINVTAATGSAASASTTSAGPTATATSSASTATTAVVPSGGTMSETTTAAVDGVLATEICKKVVEVLKKDDIKEFDELIQKIKSEKLNFNNKSNLENNPNACFLTDVFRFATVKMLDHILTKYGSEFKLEDIENKTVSEFDAVSLAIESDRVDILEYLFKTYPNKYKVTHTYSIDGAPRLSLLFIAAMHGSVNVFEHLLKTYPKIFTIQDKYVDKNILFFVVGHPKCFSFIDYLLTHHSQHFNVNEKFMERFTLLDFSLGVNVPILLEHGIYVDPALAIRNPGFPDPFPDPDPDPDPLKRHYIRMALVLLANVKSPDRKIEDPKIDVWRFASALIPENKTLQLSDANSRSNEGWDKAFLNGRSLENGNTVLHWIVQNAHSDFRIVGYLLSLGGNILLANKAFQTPLDLARGLEHPYMLGFFLVMLIRKYMCELNNLMEGAKNTKAALGVLETTTLENTDATIVATTAATAPLLKTSSLTKSNDINAGMALTNDGKDVKSQKDIPAATEILKSNDIPLDVKKLWKKIEENIKEFKDVIKKLKTLRESREIQQDKDKHRRIILELEFLSFVFGRLIISGPSALPTRFFMFLHNSIGFYKDMTSTISNTRFSPFFSEAYQILFDTFKTENEMEDNELKFLCNVYGRDIRSQMWKQVHRFMLDLLLGSYLYFEKSKEGLSETIAVKLNASGNPNNIPRDDETRKFMIERQIVHLLNTELESDAYAKLINQFLSTYARDFIPKATSLKGSKGSASGFVNQHKLLSGGEEEGLAIIRALNDLHQTIAQQNSVIEKNEKELEAQKKIMEQKGEELEAQKKRMEMKDKELEQQKKRIQELEATLGLAKVKDSNLAQASVVTVAEASNAATAAHVTAAIVAHSTMGAAAQVTMGAATHVTTEAAAGASPALAPVLLVQFGAIGLMPSASQPPESADKSHISKLN